MLLPPDSPFSSLSIESLISNAAESLDRSATPQVSAKLDSQSGRVSASITFDNIASTSCTTASPIREAVAQQLEVRDYKSK